MHILFRKSIIAFVLLLFVAFGLPGQALRVETKKAGGNTYTIFYRDAFLLDVTLKRPENNDKNIVLCIPGTFTDLSNYGVDGLFIDKGTIHNKEKINHTLGGGIKIIKGDCEIFSTAKGRLLNDSLVKLVVASKGSLFQQIQMITKGKGATYTDTKSFQRRAIVKLKGNKTAVIESFEFITLEVFTKDMLELGVTDALYTDMGAWDEGWYRTSDNKIHVVGRMKSQTDKQSNWVLFKIK